MFTICNMYDMPLKSTICRYAADLRPGGTFCPLSSVYFRKASSAKRFSSCASRMATFAKAHAHIARS